jgi:hypothetical protein
MVSIHSRHETPWHKGRAQRAGHKTSFRLVYKELACIFVRVVVVTNLDWDWSIKALHFPVVVPWLLWVSSEWSLGGVVSLMVRWSKFVVNGEL